MPVRRAGGDPPDPPLVVVHEDACVVALDKPAGLLCVPGRGEGLVHNLWSLALPRWPTLRIVHRLDQATSGLVLFALDAGTHRTLSTAFERRAVDKRYEALVHGEPPAGAGSIDLPLAADWPNRPRQRVDPLGGRPSLTHWRLLAPGASGSRLELQPVTGRSHQLRVHLAAIGHPVQGDRLYGPVDDPAPRLMLHARALRLAHPADGGELALEAAVPF